MQWANPKAAGGSEPSLTEMIETWIELAWQDGSVGWVGIANFPSAAVCASYLPDEGFKEVFTQREIASPPAGNSFPTVSGRPSAVATRSPVHGTSARVPGTPLRLRRVHCDRRRRDAVGGRRVAPTDGGGHPPPGDRLHGRMARAGAEGDGSFDYNVQDLFVPASRTFELMCQTPLRGESPTFFMGLIPVTAAGHASWALGVAKSMLDDVSELAQSKVRMGDAASLAHRDSFQRNLSHHLAMWKAALAGG